MKLLVLGTSNSILKDGWVGGLRNVLPEAEIENLSVGASPGIQFATEIARDFSIYDAVFFDSIVNDEHLLSSIGELSYINRVLYELLSTIAGQTVLFVMGFTKAKYLKRSSTVFRSRITLARTIGVQFVDVRNLVATFGDKIKQPDEPIYEHVGHPLRIVSRSIGEAIGAALPGYLATARPVLNSPSFKTCFRTFVPEDLAPPDRIADVANKLLKARFATVLPGETITFDAPRVCLGFYVNSMATKAFLGLRGPDGGRDKEVWYDIAAHKLLVKFVPIKNGFSLDRIEVLKSELPFETSVHSRFYGWPKEGEAQIAMGRVLFWERNPAASMPGAGDGADSSGNFQAQIFSVMESRWT